MTTAMFTKESVVVASSRKVLPMEELAEQLRGNAINRAQQKLAPFQRDDDLPTLLEKPAFLDAFVHAIAGGVAAAIGENDPFVQAVYTYDPSANPDNESGDDLPISGTIHLLVRVTQPSAALDAFIAALDQALTAQLRELPSSKFARRTSVLDVNLLTEQEVQRGAGFAAMLSSVFAPPIQVWQRKN
jgi:hypothetical protein